jgi:zinc/manganese transport system substrate-binding protein
MTRGFMATALGALMVLMVPASAEAGLKVFACVPEWGALAEAIGGDAVEVTTALSPLDNPDAVRPTPALIAELQEADLLVCTGAGLEREWLPSMLDRAQNAAVMPGQPGNFVASDFVALIADTMHDAAHENEEEGAHLHAGGNPHIQGDPGNVIKIAAQLARRMIELDPENEAAYGDRARSFIRDLGEVKKELEAQAAPLQGMNVAVQHEHSLYLLNWLGIRTMATVEPEPGVPPGPAHLAAIIEEVPHEHLKFVVYAAYEDPSPSRFVAEKAGIPLVMVPFTVGGTEAAADFAGFYRDSVERLLDGLNGVGRS